MILGANKQQSQGKDGNFGTSHGEKILRPGNHLLAEICVRARVFSSQDAESGVLEISGTLHYTQNMKALGLVVSEKISFMFSHCKSMGANDPWMGPFLTAGVWLAGFINRTTIHCYIQNMKLWALWFPRRYFVGFFT